jgi:hypothetical protein
MITVTDALSTVEFDDYYVILPAAPPRWDIESFIQESDNTPGRYVTDGFYYNSGTNSHFLTVAELRDLIQTELHA